MRYWIRMQIPSDNIKFAFLTITSVQFPVEYICYCDHNILTKSTLGFSLGHTTASLSGTIQFSYFYLFVHTFNVFFYVTDTFRYLAFFLLLIVWVHCTASISSLSRFYQYSDASLFYEVRLPTVMVLHSVSRCYFNHFVYTFSSELPCSSLSSIRFLEQMRLLDLHL